MKFRSPPGWSPMSLPAMRHGVGTSCCPPLRAQDQSRSLRGGWETDAHLSSGAGIDFLHLLWWHEPAAHHILGDRARKQEVFEVAFAAGLGAAAGHLEAAERMAIDD